ncbi:hypothetical protein HER10_EVM0005774 [Colletotrichum scovillei]|uniref:Monooxygenase n=1 Tax=Colletotrichum scovillei TaxID=1209932 RepID=A0A9P7QXX7_9PEZI|nr:uncharacterized protein HER10_EVM0005774 [Colletotrichum scovillei]KAF4778492.1 hypothetical protein HER10_EVM0005774 [Colletotrichum scovillei]KAG7043653.1 putative monooxygenase [Colletotrichum scovillei]KAG7045755.1 putative monooxygenase [Colletotrichum scovillei]KAG7063102.1 putative monooxygenase [Colletotrichum scovillei]
MTDGSTSFKVIIVGAGVTGLTLAHCLVKANIDFVLLDKGIVAPSFGTTITLQPHGCRILHQLGCLDAVMATCDVMGGAQCRDPSGRTFASNDFFGVVRKFAGYDTRTLDRQVFLRKLYERLPDHSKVHEKARVQEITEESSKTRVILADGREFVGDVVVGADGVHSKVREIMWDKANAANPGMITVEEKRAMVTQYNAIVMASSPVPGLGSHDMEVTSNDKFSFLLLCQPEWISIIVHNKLPEEQHCTWPTRRRYTESDMEALVSKISEYPVTETVVFGELWKRRLKAQMISLEEGVLENWFFGRIVLAGDAVHKVTPNSALGGNTAMEDAVTLANAIHALLGTHSNKNPSDVELRDAMRDKYQNARVDRARVIVKVGGDLTRQQAYDGWKAYFVQRWLTPIVGLDTLAKNIAGLCVTAPKLTYVDFDEKRGILGWQDTLSAVKEREAREDDERLNSGPSWGDLNGGFESVFPQVLAVLVALWLTICVFHIVFSRQSIPGFGREIWQIDGMENGTFGLAA